MRRMKDKAGSSGSQRPEISKAEAQKLEERIRQVGGDSEQLLKQYRVFERHAEPRPIPLKPPWDRRGGVVYAAFSSKREYQGEEPQWMTEMITSKGKVSRLEELGFTIDPNWREGDYVDWGPESVQRVIDGRADMPDIRGLFRQRKENLEWFVDLPNTGDVPPEHVGEFLALWSLGTFCMPVWAAYGYLHFDAPNEACGKSRAGEVVSRMSFWHVALAANSSFPEWRDTAHFGRTQFLDDVPNLSDLPPQARAMLYVGYKREGGGVRLKRRTDKEGWEGMEVRVFAPRIFAAVAVMDPMLRSRCFRFEMRRTDKDEITRRDPSRVDWPQSPAAVRDAAYLWAFTSMSEVEAMYNSSRVDVLTGRGHEISRPILTMAAIVEDAGERGLFERTVHLLEVMDKESQRDRAQASGYAHLVKTAWDCVREGNLAPMAKEVAGRMGTEFSRPSPIDVGRQLRGAPWVDKASTVHGTTHYHLNAEKLAKELVRLDLAEDEEVSPAAKQLAHVGGDG